MAVNEAQAEVNGGVERAVPLHLRDASKDGKALGHGRGYKYQHDFENHYVKQEYMPDPIRFYEPSDHGDEKRIRERLDSLRRKKPG